MKVEFTLNGAITAVDAPPSELLSETLRERMNLTGTHIGCDTSQCGACVVHLNGRSVKSCTVLTATLQGTTLTTIEGLAKGTVLHPMQRAFHENHGLQCGFCTPGMVMSAIDFARRTPSPTAEQARHWLEGNFCRCTGYQNIVKSVLAAAAETYQTEGA